jgi:hypothetical protein
VFSTVPLSVIDWNEMEAPTVTRAALVSIEQANPQVLEFSDKTVCVRDNATLELICPQSDNSIALAGFPFEPVLVEPHVLHVTTLNEAVSATTAHTKSLINNIQERGKPQNQLGPGNRLMSVGMVDEIENQSIINETTTLRHKLSKEEDEQPQESDLDRLSERLSLTSVDSILSEMLIDLETSHGLDDKEAASVKTLELKVQTLKCQLRAQSAYGSRNPEAVFNAWSNEVIDNDTNAKELALQAHPQVPSEVTDNDMSEQCSLETQLKMAKLHLDQALSRRVERKRRSKSAWRIPSLVRLASFSETGNETES